MKRFIKIIYSLTFVTLFSLVGFASAKATTFSTKDCYRKNHSYQCTIKTCKTAKPKSCTYKIIKATPPVINPVVTEVKQTQAYFGIKSCDQYVELMTCIINKIPKSDQSETIKSYNDVVKTRSTFHGDDLKSICDQTQAALQSNPADFKTLSCGAGYIYDTGIVLTGSATASGVITTGVILTGSSGAVMTGSTGAILTGSTGNKSSIVNIPNTSNTIADLAKFYNMISGSIVIPVSGAKFSIVEFADFECKYCQKFHQMNVLQTVMSAYPNNINYYFVNFPLSQVHKNANYLAKGYICTVLQDKGQAVGYMNYVYNQSGDPIALLDEFKKGLDSKQFDACMLDTNSDSILNYQISVGNYVGVNATPTVMLINNDTSEYESIAGAYDSTAYTSILQTRSDRMKK